MGFLRHRYSCNGIDFSPARQSAKPALRHRAQRWRRKRKQTIRCKMAFRTTDGMGWIAGNHYWRDGAVSLGSGDDGLLGHVIMFQARVANMKRYDARMATSVVANAAFK